MIKQWYLAAILMDKLNTVTQIYGMKINGKKTEI